MKIVVVVLLVVTVKVCAALEDEDNNFRECLAENDIREGEFEELMKNDDPKVHCLAACLYEREGMLKDEELNKAAVVEFILADYPKMRPDKAYEAIDTCMLEVNDVYDICDVTSVLMICLPDLLEQESFKKTDLS